MTNRPELSDQDAIDQKVRRQAGISALQKLRHMVDAESTQRENDRQFVKRAVIGIGLIVFAVVIAALWFRGII